MTCLGYMPTEFTSVPPDWRSNVPYTLDSNQRISYQQPNQIPPLTNNTERFGHSANDRHKLLVGIGTSSNTCIFIGIDTSPNTYTHIGVGTLPICAIFVCRQCVINSYASNVCVCRQALACISVIRCGL